MSDAVPAAQLRGVRMEFRVAGHAIQVLDVPRLDVARESSTGLAGPSGSGKTTLLNIIAGILVPTQAAVLVDGADVSSLPPPARDEFRAQRIGQIFQTFNLIPALSR